ncbi:Hypothetical protein A7982_03184 [Minicystis rosea]|nr:Hypothetical protein A7982_03184 [Minicystis rosea]
MIALLWIIPLVVLAALVVRAIVFGYPPPQLPSGSFLNRKEQAVVAACADALFPPGGPIPLSGTEAGLVAYMDRYLSGLPALPRLLGRLLFHSIEHGPWLFGPRRVRFTRLTPAERIAMLKEMSLSSMYFRRVSFISMRAMMTMGYLAHPDVAKKMRMVCDVAPFDRGRSGARASQEVFA